MKKIKNEIDCKLLTSTTFQIAFLRKLEEKIKIEHLDIDFEKHNNILDQLFEDNENILNTYLKTFPNTSRKTPITTKRDIFEILVKGYNSIVPKLFDSIEGKTKKVNKKVLRIPTIYKINKNLLINHMDLIAIKNKYYDKIDVNLLNLLEIVKPERIEHFNNVTQEDIVRTKWFNLGFNKNEIDEMMKDYIQDKNKTYLFNEPEYSIFPCNLSIDQILEKAYDEREKKQKKMKEQEIKRLIDMDVLTPKEREKIVVNHNKSQQEIKKEYDRERQRQYRLNKKSKIAIE